MDTRRNGESESRLALNRRKFLGFFSAAGLGGTLFPGALLAVARDAPQVTPEMVGSAAGIAGIPLSEDERKQVAEGLNREGGLLQSFRSLREINLGNDTPLALAFNPLLPGDEPPRGKSCLKLSRVKVMRPKTDEDLAFLPVTHLARLLKNREVTSLDLTKLSLERLKKFDPVLKCVVTLTEELALEQAAHADREIASGKYRGPLHGVPWGAKDLLAVKGYTTTFGASPYKDQGIDPPSPNPDGTHFSGIWSLIQPSAGRSS